MIESARAEFARIMASDEEVEAKIKAAVRAAFRHHRQKGQKVVVWIDNKPVWIDPPIEISE